MKDVKKHTLLFILAFLVLVVPNANANQKNDKEKQEKILKLRKLVRKTSDGNSEKIMENVWIISGDSIMIDTCFIFNNGKGLHNLILKDIDISDSTHIKDRSVYLRCKPICLRTNITGKLKDAFTVVLSDSAMHNSIHVDVDEIDSLINGTFKTQIIHSSFITDSILSHFRFTDKKGLKVFDICSGKDAKVFAYSMDSVLKSFSSAHCFTLSNKNCNDEDKLVHLVRGGTVVSLVLKSYDNLDKEEKSALKKAGIKMAKKRLDIEHVFISTSDKEGKVRLKFELSAEGKTVLKIIDGKDGRELFLDKIDGYFPGTYDKSVPINLDQSGTYYIYIEQNGKDYLTMLKLD